MKKLMTYTVAGLVCGLALLAAPAAHAQEVVTLWEPTAPQIERVDAGHCHEAEAAVQTLFDKMLCATDSRNHYLIGQRQGQYLIPLVDVPPTQMKNQGQNTILWWGQVQQGTLQGAQVTGQFTQVAPQQIDAKLRIQQTGQQPVDVTAHCQMKLIYQKPGAGNDLYRNGKFRPVRVKYDQWGGYAGICRQATIEVAHLSTVDFEDLVTKLEAANFFHLPWRMEGRGGPELNHYKITVETANGSYTVLTDSAAAPAALKPLIQWLQARSKNGWGCPR